VADDAEPGSDGGEGFVEAGGLEAGAEAVFLEVDRDKVRGGGGRDGGGGEKLFLPGLGGGVIDFEDAEGGVGVAAGEGVEAGAEDQVLLRGVGLEGGGKGVFGEAGADDHEGSEGGGEGALDAVGGAVYFFGVLLA